MSWRLLLSFALALAYLAWILRDRNAYTRSESILALVGSVGILIHLSSLCMSRLPSHAPLRTVTGLAINRSFSWFDHSDSTFLLLEAGSGRRTLFTTVIDGPWADQPIRAVDDGRFMASVVTIEIVNDDRLPWRVQNGDTGWVGTADARRQAPSVVRLLGFVCIFVGILAPLTRIDRHRKIRDAKLEASAG